MSAPVLQAPRQSGRGAQPASVQRLRDLEADQAAFNGECVDFATDIRAHALRIHMAAQCDRLDIAAHEAAAIVEAADRHLRQRGAA